MKCPIDIGQPYIPERTFETIQIAYDPYNMHSNALKRQHKQAKSDDKMLVSVPDGEIFIMLVLALILIYLFHLM